MALSCPEKSVGEPIYKSAPPLLAPVDSKLVILLCGEYEHLKRFEKTVACSLGFGVQRSKSQLVKRLGTKLKEKPNNFECYRILCITTTCTFYQKFSSSGTPLKIATPICV